VCVRSGCLGSELLRACGCGCIRGHLVASYIILSEQMHASACTNSKMAVAKRTLAYLTDGQLDAIASLRLADFTHGASRVIFERARLARPH
jgi:hypothetical protein